MAVTYTVGPGGAPTYDYGSLNAAEADLDGGTLTDNLIINCYAFEDTTQVTWGGFDSAGYSTTIQAVNLSNQHDGTRGNGYRIDVDSGVGPAFYLVGGGDAAYDLRLIGIAGSNTYSSKHGFHIATAHADTVIHFERLLTYDNTSNGLNISVGSSAVVRNCISIGNTYQGIVTGIDTTIDNCVAGGNADHGIKQGGGTVTCRNCYSGGNTNADYDGTIGKTTCASEDGTGGATVAYATGSGAYFTNVTAGSEDFNLSTTDSSLYDAGTDLSATFTDDIVGTTRSQWDIGAFEYVATSGLSIPVAMYYYAQQ